MLGPRVFPVVVSLPCLMRVVCSHVVVFSCGCGPKVFDKMPLRGACVCVCVNLSYTGRGLNLIECARGPGLSHATWVNEAGM